MKPRLVVLDIPPLRCLSFSLTILALKCMIRFDNTLDRQWVPGMAPTWPLRKDAAPHG